MVCGAFNMAVGDLVPFAPVGTVMPNGLQITRRKMRGEWSDGMLCSAAELGLPDDSGGAGILVLPPSVAPPGTPFKQALGLASVTTKKFDCTIRVHTVRPPAVRNVFLTLGQFPQPLLQFFHGNGDRARGD